MRREFFSFEVYTFMMRRECHGHRVQICTYDADSVVYPDPHLLVVSNLSLTYI